jgi:hypothetical protein
MIGFENFHLRQFKLPDGIHINARVSAGTPSPSRPPLFLLHGFPQTHVCWRRVAQQLQQDFLIILPDLRGYGDSAQPPGAEDHSNYSKREMAADVVAVAGVAADASLLWVGVRLQAAARVAHSSLTWLCAVSLPYSPAGGSCLSMQMTWAFPIAQAPPGSATAYGRWFEPHATHTPCFLHFVGRCVYCRPAGHCRLLHCERDRGGRVAVLLLHSCSTCCVLLTPNVLLMLHLLLHVLQTSLA